MKKDLKKQYPAMPEEFHNALLDALYEEDESRQQVRRSKFFLRKPAWFLGAAAAVLLLAAAGSYKGLTTFFPNSFVSEEAAAGINTGIITEVSGPSHFASDIENGKVEMTSLPEAPVKESLVRITEAKCDGIELFAVLEKTAAAEGYDIALKEIYINDELSEGMPACTDIGEGTFALHADIHAMNPGASFKVTLAVNVYGRDGNRYQNQEISFFMTGGSGVIRKLYEPVVFSHDECKVTVLGAEASANCLRVELCTEVSEAFRNEEGVHFSLLTEAGDELAVLDGKRTVSGDRFTDVLICGGYSEIPENVCLAIRIGKKGEAYSLSPVKYTDTIKLE